MTKLLEETQYRGICFYNNEVSQFTPQVKEQFSLIEFVDLSAMTSDLYKTMYEEFNSEVKTVCLRILERYQPENLVFFNEFYFLKYFKEDEQRKTYIVRNLSKPLIEKLSNNNDQSFRSKESLRIEMRRNIAESEVIDLADYYIVDSLNAKEALLKYYQKEGRLAKGIANLDRFLDIKKPNLNLQHAYYLGRLDWQKGVQNLSSPRAFQLDLIGGQILTKGEVSHLGKARFHGWLSPDEYLPIVKDIPFALFPHLWESNGLTVQEALAMGKIVFVQEGSGGCEEHIDHGETGFIVDFKNNHWEDIILKYKSKYEFDRVSDNAKKLFQKGDWDRSIIELGNIIKELPQNEI